MAYGGDSIEASEKAVMELTKEIVTCMKTVMTLNDDLSGQLGKLGNTFQDEGYGIIQDYIKKTQQKVPDAVPDLKAVVDKLTEYASLIRQSRSQIG